MEEKLLAIDYEYDNKENAKKAVSFLAYSDCHKAQIELDESSALYTILVPESKLQVANKLIEMYELEKSKTDSDEDLKEDQKAVKPYIEPKVRFDDMHSSATSFLLIGVVGFIIVILGMTKIIPLPFAEGNLYFSGSIMGIVFIVFTIIGLYSLKSARNIKKLISMEEKFIKDVHDWFNINYTKDIIDQQTASRGAGNNTAAEKYFERIGFIKSSIEDKFPDIDESLLDKLSEDFYQTIFE